MYSHIIVRDGIVESVSESAGAVRITPPGGCEVIEVEGEVGAFAGCRLGWLDENYRMRPLSELAAEGKFTPPEGFRLEGDRLVEMTKEEKIVGGVIPPDEGTKVDGGRIVPMTDREKVESGQRELAPDEKLDGDTIVRKTAYELYAEGLISADEANERIIELRKAAYARRSTPIMCEAMEKGDDELMQRFRDEVAAIKQELPKVWDKEGNDEV